MAEPIPVKISFGYSKSPAPNPFSIPVDTALAGLKAERPVPNLWRKESFGVVLVIFAASAPRPDF